MLDEEAERLQTTLDALALATVLAQPWADVVLSGAATTEHLLAEPGGPGGRLGRRGGKPAPAPGRTPRSLLAVSRRSGLELRGRPDRVRPARRFMPPAQAG